MSFTIKIQSFEGPLDLLLELIEKRKLFISDISLANVTDDFIEHVKGLDAMPMGESAHFILIASTLLLIKSRSLLPQIELTEGEQSDIRDLETRLKIYRRIKEASKNVQQLFGAAVIFQQSHARRIDPVFAPDPEFCLEKALASLRDIIARLPKQERLPMLTVSKIISLEDMISDLTNRVTSQLRMSFSQFTKNRAEKVNVIVSFLAMLELVKQGVLHVSQEKAFSEIEMETRKVGVPSY